MDKKNILIIGMSKTGKTHFGGQLYGRLKTGQNEFVLQETPNDLSLFQDILDNLNQGLEGKHTDSKLHETIVLPVMSKSGNNIDLIYPDYGGEQLRGMIEQRKINEVWQNQILASTHWFLFIRLDLIEDISDVTTKFYSQIEEEKNVKSKDINITDIPVVSSAFYVELLQTFLFAKGLNVRSENKPPLTVILSCWDKLKQRKNSLPGDVLENKMPLLHRFITNSWNEKVLSIVGLSSLSKDLHAKKPDVDFAIDGPENFGYFVNETGKIESDLTYLLNQVVI